MGEGVYTVQLVTPGGGGGLGCAPNILHERMTPDLLACGQLIAMFVCGGGGEYQLVTLGGGTGPRAVCVNMVILIMTHLRVNVTFSFMSQSALCRSA